MGISVWDYVNGKHLDRLTHRQRAVQHAAVAILAAPALVLCLWLAGVLVGWHVNLETALASVAGLLIGGAIYTTAELIRGPKPTTAPELHLTDEMSRRIR